MKRNHLGIFGRGHYGEQFCETILTLNQWFKRCHVKIFLSTALVAILLKEPNNLGNFGRNLRRNSCVKLFLICASGLGCCLRSQKLPLCLWPR